MSQMRMKFNSLVLNCKESRETLEFAKNITFFHGEIGTGKSSVARLIDFCLGGNTERTPAIQSELLSAALTARLGQYQVLFERSLRNASRIVISWRDAAGRGASVSAPLTEGTEEIWRDDDEKPLYTASDMIYYLLAIRPPKVRKNKINPDADLVRLSFRDMMWYCYLPQEEMDFTFYNNDNAGGFKRSKSRDIIRYVLGFHSDRLNELEIDLEAMVSEQKAKLAAAQQIHNFLTRHGLGTIDSIQKQKEDIEVQLAIAREAYGTVRHGQRTSTHIVDPLRAKLRELSNRINEEEQTLHHLSERLDQQESLKAELLVTKFKLARTGSAATVLTGVKFDFCPNCGTSVTGREAREDQCSLCLQVPQINEDLSSLAQSEAINYDLDSRIAEIEDSIRRYREAKKAQERRVASIQTEKYSLDERLNQELADYDSANMARVREAERALATLEERLASLDRILSLPEAVRQLQEEANGLTQRINELREEVESEKGTFAESDRFRQQLEDAYLDALLAVRFPGVSQRDQVVINPTSWEAEIRPNGDENRAWGYGNAGSGGKKTLLKVCFGLAFHRVAAENDLPLPTFLIIDSPMKNIDPQVNDANFTAFYEYLLNVAEGPLCDTQFILIDNVYPNLASTEIDIRNRRMTLSDLEYPPLISYYRE